MQVWTKQLSTASTHKQVILCCREIHFFQLFLYLDQRNVTQRHLLAICFFSGTAQIEHVMVAIGKSGLGKTRMGGRGDMLLLLVTIGEPSIAGYLRVWRRRYRRTTPGHRTPTTYRAT